AEDAVTPAGGEAREEQAPEVRVLQQRPRPSSHCRRLGADRHEVRVEPRRRAWVKDLVAGAHGGSGGLAPRDDTLRALRGRWRSHRTGVAGAHGGSGGLAPRDDTLRALRGRWRSHRTGVAGALSLASRRLCAVW